jgi:PPOX class probable F420-dependent enzyme
VNPLVPDASERFRAARVARLATTNANGTPHLVPVVFALVGETVWTAVDDKPKTTTALRRLENVRARPGVSLLVDHYADDWSALWWVRADGTGTVLDAGEAGDGVAALVAKYEHYQRRPPHGPVLRIDVTRWTSWSAR